MGHTATWTGPRQWISARAARRRTVRATGPRERSDTSTRCRYARVEGADGGRGPRRLAGACGTHTAAASCTAQGRRGKLSTREVVAYQATGRRAFATTTLPLTVAHYTNHKPCGEDLKSRPRGTNGRGASTWRGARPIEAASRTAASYCRVCAGLLTSRGGLLNGNMQTGRGSRRERESKSEERRFRSGMFCVQYFCSERIRDF